MGRPTVVIELAESATFGRDLAAGGLMLPRCDVPLHEECELLVRGVAGELRIPAKVVYVDPKGGGAGVELIGATPELKAQIAELARAEATKPKPVFYDDDGNPLGGETPGAAASPTEAAGAAASSDDGDGDRADTATDGADGADGAGDDDDDGDDDEKRTPLAKNIHERLRGLSMAEAVKAAQSNDPTERMALERLYGKNVWEALLRNPRLTAPEVSRLARMGTLPRIMLEHILNNAAWLQIPEVRRALLSNPRLGTDQIMRVIRLLPKHELKVASTMAAYPMAVRNEAKKLIKIG